ncbi:MAG: plasmid mobilization protein [Streptosporangiaceae bacterium]
MAYVIRDDEVRDDDPSGSARPRRRTRHQERRGRTVRFALTDAEYAEVSAAARQAGLARGAYAAEAALSVARGEIATPDAPLRDAFHALDRAALLVRRIGVNLNQAVAKLNATGQWSGDLVPYAEESVRRAARLEAAGEDLRKRFLRTIRAPGPRGRTAGSESAPRSAVPG